MVSVGHVRGTCGSGMVSSTADVLWMSVVRTWISLDIIHFCEKQ